MTHSQRQKKGQLIPEEIVNSLGLPVIVIDHKLKYISLNRKGAQVFKGVSEVSDFVALMDKDTSGKFLKNCKAVINQGKEKKQPVRIHKKDWSLTIYPNKKKGITLLLQPLSDVAQGEGTQQDRYQQLLDCMGDSFMLTDENLKIIDINKSFCKAIGFSRKELLGSDSSLIDHFLSAAEIKKLHKKSEKGNITFDTQNTDQKGNLLEAEVNMFLLKRDGKKYYGSIGRNITDYKKVQTELEKTNDRFNRITNATRDALWELNVDTGERWANEVHQRLYGLTTKDPMPPEKEWIRRIHPSVRKEITESLDRAIAQKEKNWNSEYWFKVGTNKWIYIYDRTLLSYHKNGKIEKMMGSMVDVTELKNALEELTIQKNLSERIINALPGIFYLLDKEGKLKRWNKNLEAITGYTEQEIRLMKPADFFYHQEAKKLNSVLEEVYQKGWAEMEATLVSKSGEGHPFYMSGWRIIFENEECIIGTGIDMSEIKKVQDSLKRMEIQITEQRVQEQKLLSRAIITAQEKERNHIGRELHDNVNQLLAGARLYLTMGGKKSSEFKEMIKYPIELLDNGIQEIRLLTHRHISPAKDVNLKQLTEGITGLLKTASIECKLHYNIQSPISENLLINIYRILQEEANNIIKHSKARNASLSVYSEDCKIFIITEDDGIGFDIHSRKEGIGLININNRVNAYNGTISIDTSPGNGCKIQIVIPVPDCGA